MYSFIFRIVVDKNDEEIISYYYTVWSDACKDGKRLAIERKEKKDIDFFRQKFSHFDRASTIVYNFDDDVLIAVEECGLAYDYDVSGKVRAVLGVDYTGTAQEKFFDTEREFEDYIKSTQPIWE